MKRNIFKTILLSACILQGGSALAQQEKAEPGKFSPTWESLSQYEVPEWFRNAKFGIWAHCKYSINSPFHSKNVMLLL